MPSSPDSLEAKRKLLSHSIFQDARIASISGPIAETWNYLIQAVYYRTGDSKMDIQRIKSFSGDLLERVTVVLKSLKNEQCDPQSERFQILATNISRAFADLYDVLAELGLEKHLLLLINLEFRTDIPEGVSPEELGREIFTAVTNYITQAGDTTPFGSTATGTRVYSAMLDRLPKDNGVAKLAAVADIGAGQPEPQKSQSNPPDTQRGIGPKAPDTSGAPGAIQKEKPRVPTLKPSLEMFHPVLLPTTAASPVKPQLPPVSAPQPKPQPASAPAAATMPAHAPAHVPAPISIPAQSPVPAPQPLASQPSAQVVPLSGPSSPDTIPQEPPPTAESTQRSTRSRLIIAFGAAAAVIALGVGGKAAYDYYKSPADTTQKTAPSASASSSQSSQAPSASQNSPSPEAEKKQHPNQSATEKTAQSQHKNLYGIDTGHADFKKFTNQYLSGQHLLISTLKSAADQSDVELTGEEPSIRAKFKIFRAFLEKGVQTSRGFSQYYINQCLEKISALESNLTAVEAQISSGKTMTESEIISEVFKGGQFKQVRLLFDATQNSVVKSLPEHIAGYAIELDETKNHELAVFRTRYSKGASTFCDVVMQVLNEQNTRPFERSDQSYLAQELLNRVKQKGNIRRLKNKDDGTSLVAEQLYKQIENGTSDHLITDFLMHVVPVEKTGAPDNQKLSPANDSEKATDPASPAPAPTHSLNTQPVNPVPVNQSTQFTTIKPAQTQYSSPFGTMADVDALKDGWDLPDDHGRDLSDQTVCTQDDSIDVDLSELEDNSMCIPAGVVVNNSSAPLIAENNAAVNPGAEGVTAPSFNGTEEKFFARGEQITKENIAQARENAEFKAQCPEWFGEEPAPPRRGVAGFVKSLFAKKTPEEQAKAETAKQIPKKSWLKNIFG
jgi:hypothetical protein